MPCYKPLSAFQHTETRAVTFRETAHTRPLTLPCGQCIGCRLEKSRQWALRCVLEARMHKQNSFLTLTYADENLPQLGSLQKSDLQKFFKRLRFHLGDKTIRYYACGEYGDNTKRAHYHACLFGHDFDDKKKFRQIGDNTLYTSKTLEQIWGLGQCTIGELTFESAAYTARYVMKKQTGLAKKGGGYAVTDPQTGELIHVTQPFALMSLREAIGKTWHDTYHGDIWNNDKDALRIKGVKLKPPKYYDKLYDLINPEHMAMIRKKRYTESKGYNEQELQAHAKNTRARIISKTQI